MTSPTGGSAPAPGAVPPPVPTPVPPPVPTPVGLDLLAVIAAGGCLGALARYGLGLALPATPSGFPTAIFLINVLGCLSMGVLMGVLTQRSRPAHRYVRPFLGVGVLGGFTTFSTYAADTRRLLADGAYGTAAGYLLGSVLVGLSAVWLGGAAVRMLLPRQSVPAEQAVVPAIEEGEA